MTPPVAPPTVACDSYLGLPRIRTAQQPLSDGDVWLSEHLFIVTHQGCELRTKQVLMDCDDEATPIMRLSTSDLAAAQDLLHRAGAVISLMTAHLRILSRMAPRHFAAFRPLLGHASGPTPSRSVN